MKQITKDSPAAAAYKNGFDSHWVNGWLARTKTDITHTCNGSLDANRAKWCSPENVALHHVLLGEAMVANGAGTHNPNCDWKDPDDAMIKITHPELMMSFDETGFDVDQNKDSSKGIHVREDTGEKTKQGKTKARGPPPDHDNEGGGQQTRTQPHTCTHAFWCAMGTRCMPIFL